MLKTIKTRLGIKNVTPELAAIYAYKKVRQQLTFRKPEPQKILAIVGCQRSGTSLMTRVFERDVNAAVYRESSRLSSKDPAKLRLNPLPEVRAEMAHHKARLIVFKPLVETQNTLQLLAELPDAYALWMYRHYKDVAASSLKAFGGRVGIRDLRAIVRQEPDNWRSEKVSEATRSIICAHFSEDMNPYDAAALFWFARNRLFFNLNLATHPRVLMCWYDDLVTDPTGMVQTIYHSMDLPYPGPQIVKDVRASSVGKGKQVDLSPEIETVCHNLLKELQQVQSTYVNEPAR